jgi:hypothetical protein
MKEVLYMDTDTFLALVNWFEERGLLKPGREATIIEQVAIFIYMVGHQSSN